MEDVTYYSSSNVSGILIAPHIVFSVVATILVGLRLYTSRVVTKTPWTVDETICVVALVANHIMLICEGAAVPYGLGTDMATIATMPQGVAGFLKCILAIEISYGTACPLSKIAVLAMYYRIFSASRIIRWCVWAISSMLVGWGIAVVAVSIFSCDPVAGFWNPAIARSCIDSSKFYIGITVPNIIFDILTVALPIHEVWQLQMGREKKLAISGVFLLGGSVVLASVARLILFCIYRPGAGASGNNISQTVIIPHAASAIETCLAIIGACLPPCAPLFRRFWGGVATAVSGERGSAKTADKSSKNFNTLITIGKMSNRGGPRDKWSEDHDLDGSFERLEDGSSLQGSTDDLYGERGDTRTNNRVSEYGDGIHVQRDVQVHRGGKSTPADVQKWVAGDIPLKEMATRPQGQGLPGQAQ